MTQWSSTHVSLTMYSNGQRDTSAALLVLSYRSHPLCNLIKNLSYNLVSVSQSSASSVAPLPIPREIIELAMTKVGGWVVVNTLYAFNQFPVLLSSAQMHLLLVASHLMEFVFCLSMSSSLVVLRLTVSDWTDGGRTTEGHDLIKPALQRLISATYSASVWLSSGSDAYKCNKRPQRAETDESPGVI